MVSRRIPTTQNVNVTSGQLEVTAPPVTTGFSGEFCAEAGQVTVNPLPSSINATNLAISHRDNEVGVYFNSPLAIQGSGFSGVGPSVFVRGL
jgi:hypothetical protein